MKPRGAWRRLGAALAAYLAAAGAALGASDAKQAPPLRIVSLNLCLDAILVELVPHERIAALSHYSRDPWRSAIAPLAQQLPVTYESAEEVVALQPDLVLTSRHSAIATRNALRRIGIRYELFDVAFSITDSLQQIRSIAALVGRPEAGAALITRIQDAIEAARPPPGARRLSAAVYEAGGLTAGTNTVTDELMRIVGLDNLASRYDVQLHRPLALELLVAARPDVLLVGDAPESAPMQAAQIIHHRVLRALPSMRHVFPARLMYCSGPTIIEETAVLVAARERAYASLQAAADL